MTFTSPYMHEHEVIGTFSYWVLSLFVGSKEALGVYVWITRSVIEESIQALQVPAPPTDSMANKTDIPLPIPVD